MRRDIKQNINVKGQTKGHKDNVQQNKIMREQSNNRKKQILTGQNQSKNPYQQQNMHIYQPGLFISSDSSASHLEQKAQKHNLISSDIQCLQFNSYDQQINLLLTNSIGSKTQKQQHSLMSGKTCKYLKCLVEWKKDSGSRQKMYYQGVSGISDGSRKERSSGSHKYQFLIDAKKQSTYQEIEEDFSHKQKQSLKNAFRYICRLIFKQSSKYQNKINEIAHRLNQLSSNEKVNVPANQKQNEFQKNDQKKPPSKRPQPSPCHLYLFKNAQLISGERHFKQHLSNLSPTQSLITLHYMIWFLKHKYLRYINKSNNENKGKRKDMKKDLYLKFKNEVMIGYLNAQIQAVST